MSLGKMSVESSHINTEYPKKRIYTQYFDNAFIAFGIFYAFKESRLDYIDWTTVIKYMALLTSVGFSMLSVFHNYKWTFIRTIGFCLLFFIPLYLRVAYTSNVLVSSMLILAAYNIPFSHIVKMCMRVLAIVWCIVLLALFSGMIEEQIYDRELESFGRRFAHDFGFKYYSCSYLGMGFVQCCLYLWRKRLTLIKVAFLITFSYIFFLLFVTRLQLYTCAAFIVAIVLLPRIPKKLINNKLLASVAIIAYPLICFILYYVSKYFILYYFYDGYDELNRAMSNRLSLNEEAFLRYDVTLWGNDLDFNAGVNAKGKYFYLDSGYLHVLLGDGLVFISIVLLLYSILTYKIFKARAYYLYIWILLYAILNISNGFLVAILANPILLLAFSDVKTIHDDYYASKSVIGYKK